MSDAIAQGAASMGIALPDGAAQRMERHLALVEKWNRVHNLTAVREASQMVVVHVLDSLTLLPHLGEARRVVDVGTGAGFPGIPLAIARPAWRVVMVDPNHKKAAFLTQAAIELRLGNVAAHASRVEDLRDEAPFDVVISRAFADLATFAATSARHLAPHGVLAAMKGVHPAEEIAEVESEFSVETLPLHVPGLDAARHLVLMRKP